jgi:hypothetical protein
MYSAVAFVWYSGGSPSPTTYRQKSSDTPKARTKIVRVRIRSLYLGCLIETGIGDAENSSVVCVIVECGANRQE